MDVDTLARELIDHGERDGMVITRKVAQEVIAAGEAEELLVGLLKGRIQALVRAVVKSKEEAYDRARKDQKSAERRGDHRSDYQNAATKAREELVRETFYAPGFVNSNPTWGQATRAMHQAAADHSLRIASGHTRDADRHLAVIRDLEAAGADCLDDLGVSEDEIRERIEA